MKRKLPTHVALERRLCPPYYSFVCIRAVQFDGQSVTIIL